MSVVINQNLFRHREAATAGINNLCTVIHKLADEDVYVGEVVQGRRLIGVFRLRCDKKIEATQVNIDLSGFDAVFTTNTPRLPHATEYELGKDGYIVFHATGHHTDLYVKLTKAEALKGAPSFDSRKLGKGDIVAFRLWHPGSYTIANEAGNQKVTLTVLETKKGKFHDPTKVAPVRVTLSDQGFDSSGIENQPMQPLVIIVDAAASLTLKSNQLPRDRPHAG